jgi:hypothetical protein
MEEACLAPARDLDPYTLRLRTVHCTRKPDPARGDEQERLTVELVPEVTSSGAGYGTGDQAGSSSRSGLFVTFAGLPPSASIT